MLCLPLAVDRTIDMDAGGKPVLVTVDVLSKELERGAKSTAPKGGRRHPREDPIVANDAPFAIERAERDRWFG